MNDEQNFYEDMEVLHNLQFHDTYENAMDNFLKKNNNLFSKERGHFYSSRNNINLLIHQCTLTIFLKLRHLCRQLIPMLVVSLDCPFLIATLVFSNVYLFCFSSSCVPNVACVSGLSILDFPFNFLLRLFHMFSWNIRKMNNKNAMYFMLMLIC